MRTERKGARSWHRPVTQAGLRPERQETKQLKVYLGYGVEVQGQLWQLGLYLIRKNLRALIIAQWWNARVPQEKD